MIMRKIFSEINVGRQAWEARVREIADHIHPQFFQNFVAVSRQQVEWIERSLNRSLPDDFKMFLNVFGAGNFPHEVGGGFFSPSEIIEGCAGPIEMLVGIKGNVGRDILREFYITRGEKHGREIQFLSPFQRHLFDFVQVGYDGVGCYYQVFVNSSGGSCLITPSGEIEDRCASFSQRLDLIFRQIIETRQG